MPRLSPTEPVIHAGSHIVDTRFGAYCEVGEASRILHSTFHD